MMMHDLKRLYHERDETTNRLRSYLHQAPITTPFILAPPPLEMTLCPTEEMDPRLWGNLQHHIDLERVFAKLPFREFFQLRLVCKDFNARASGEKFLEANANPISKKPFFCLVHPSGIWQVFLEYDRVFDDWHQLPISTPNITNDEHLLPPKWSAGGYLVFVEGKWPDYWIFTVFDLRTRMQHKLPPLYRDRKSYLKKWNLEGLVVNQVDNTFQLVIGSTNIQTIQTSVYDSVTKAWNQKVQPVPLELIRLEVSPSPPHGSVCHNGNLYVSMNDVPYIMCYDLALGVWSSFKCPWEDSLAIALGSWDGHLYAISSIQGEHARIIALHVHQLFEGTNKQWGEVCSVPLDLFDELFETNDSSLTYNENNIILKKYVQASFCDEFVFISVFLQDYLVVDLGSDAYRVFCKEILVPRRFALFNLKTKKWKRLDFGISKDPRRTEIDDWKKKRPKLNGAS